MNTLLEAAQKAHNTLVNLSMLGNGNLVGNSHGNIIARDAAIELEQAIADELVHQKENTTAVVSQNPAKTRDKQSCLVICKCYTPEDEKFCRNKGRCLKAIAYGEPKP